MEPSEKDMSDFLKKIFTPLLLGLGLIGNVISIIIFSKPSMRKYTTFRYLAYLSVFDLCALFTGYGQTLFVVYFDLDLRLVNVFACKIHSFLVYFFTHSSSMILVLMSVDRAIVITTKLGNKLSTPQITVKLLVSIVVAMSLINLHFIFFVHLVEFPRNPDGVGVASGFNATTAYTDVAAARNNNNNNNNSSHSLINANSAQLFGGGVVWNASQVIIECYGSPNSMYFTYLAEFFPWVDLILYAIFPSIVMLFCSIIIIAKIFSHSTKLSTHGNGNLGRKKQIKNRQISYLLLTTNFLFFFLVSPLVFLNAMKLINENSVKTTLFYFFSYSNHGLNFIFYGISCEKYRNELFSLIGCKTEKAETHLETVRTQHHHHEHRRLMMETTVE